MDRILKIVGHRKYYTKQKKLLNVIMKPSIKKIFGQKLQLSTILSIWDHNKSNRWENTTTHAILVKADEGSESNFEQIKDMTQEIQ